MAKRNTIVRNSDRAYIVCVSVALFRGGVQVFIIGVSLACRPLGVGDMMGGHEASAGVDESAGPSSTPDDSNASHSTSFESDASMESASSSSETATADTDTGEDQSDEDEGPSLRFDLAVPDANDDLGLGCAKIDFLFVVDNSSSMADEQQNLIQSFPGFIAGIREEVEADDYQLMVVETDDLIATQSSTCSSSACTCSYDPFCCAKLCNADAELNTCNSVACVDILAEHGCETTFAAGHRLGAVGSDCQFGSDHRYLHGDQAQLSDAFACAAERGVQGSDQERPMEAMLAALQPSMVDAGGCNAGFLRDDAILVVTVITDEEDDPPNSGSPGDPDDWYEQLIMRKFANETAVVTIGFIGDRDLDDPLCGPLSGVTGAEASPRLRRFFELAGDRGIAGSVCAEDFSPVFAEAIAKIDQACDDFIPPE